MTPAEALANPDSLATTLLVALIDLIGPDEVKEGETGPLDWTIETWRREVMDVAGVRLSNEALAKLEAARTIKTSDLFTHYLPSFIEIAFALSGDVPDPDEFCPADSMQCAWAVAEAAFLDDPQDIKNWLSEEVRRYIGFACVHDGFDRPFGPLEDVAIMPSGHDWSSGPHAAEIEAEQARRGQEMLEEFQERLQLLAEQLGSLELRNGDAVSFARRLIGA